VPHQQYNLQLPVFISNIRQKFLHMLVLAIISVFLLLSVVLSLVRNDYWIFRMLEYPRLQKLFLIIGVFGFWLIYWPAHNRFYQVLVAGLVLSIVYLLYKILPYTVLYKKEMKRVPHGDKANEIKLFAANVFQDNKAYGTMLEQIKSCDPDLIFLLETDKGWAEGVAKLGASYPYQLLEPIDNTYGLLFYSRFPLHEAAVKYLVKQDIPSIEAIVELPSGQKVHLWGLHPEPPVPGENLYATAKNKELMKVALKVKDCKLPCMVFGDLNDVAWSHTTELFRKTSRLLDPRRGRGFYSTFSAHHWFIRFPLDYIFCSEHFGLVHMMRLPKNGSDHFATFTHLRFQAVLKNVQEAPKADTEEINEAQEMASQQVPQ
jgi:endonuclease/exonuclease/phosphatase (EEP) superfamily protein YafD